jgi:hypothetical protein
MRGQLLALKVKGSYALQDLVILATAMQHLVAVKNARVVIRSKTGGVMDPFAQVGLLRKAIEGVRQMVGQLVVVRRFHFQRALVGMAMRSQIPGGVTR